MNTAMAGGWLPLMVLTLWAATAAGDEKMSEATSQFTLALMKKVFTQEKGNVVMSPLSVSTLLAMVYQGAYNNSASQLESVLNMTQEESRNGYQQVILNFQKRKYKSKLDFGNRIFVNNDFYVNPAFDSIMHTHFHTATEKRDFKDPEVSANRINEWASFHTKERIDKLITPASITARTQMILANAIYFKGVWLKTFSTERTTTANFHTTASVPVQAPMMAMKNLFLAGEDDVLGAKWIELSFDGGDFSMVLVLPKEDHGLSKVVNRMTFENLKNMMNTRGTKMVNLTLPRFKLNKEVQVVSSLQQLGLIDIFNQQSNLEGISSSKGPLVVSDIVHKAEIEVNEEGAEASAATVIYVNTLSLEPEFEEVDFFATQPFLAIIVDKVNKMPIFVARVTNPTR